MDEDLNERLPEAIAGALQKLDRDAAKRAGAVDAERVAARVLQRLGQEPVRVIRPRRWNLTALRVAASVAVLVIGGAVAQRLAFGPHRPAPGVDTAQVASSDATEQALLRAVDDARNVTAVSLPASTVSVYDLNEQELQTLLDSMDAQSGGSI